MPGGQVIAVGPFVGGINTYSDNSSVLDNELVMAENLELDLDGSLVSRPPFVDSGIRMPLDTTGDINVLGYYYADDGTPYLIASDGSSSTYYFTGSGWTLITNTFAASALTQYNSLAYLMAPLSSGNPGGSWSPTAGFTVINAMPKGSVLIAHKSRLWAASGQNAGTGQNGTRLYLSAVGDPTSWPGNFIAIGQGDGQNVVQLMVYYNDLLVFKKNSIYRFSYSSDPTTGTPSKISPDIGLATADAVALDNSIVYFVYNDKVYSITNYQINQVNQKVPLRATSQSGIYKPYSLSVFNRRLIVSYYDQIYVYSLRTQKWTTWRSAAFGPIGRVVQTQTNQTNQISAVAHSSAPVLPSQPPLINLVPNPRLQLPDDYTGTSSAGTGSVSFDIRTLAADAGDVPANQNFARTSATAAGLSYLDVRYNGPIQAAAGVQYTAQAETRTNNTALTTIIYLQFQDSTGAAIRTVSSAFDSGAAFNRVWVTGVAPTGTVSAQIIVRLSGAIATSNIVDATWLLMTPGAAPVAYFDGAFSSNQVYTYAWVGTSNASASTKTTKRTARTLTIVDAFIAGRSENMTCTVQTKNYNYESAGIFKRLFYWGIDAVFKGTVRGYANVVRLSSFPTWDQLLSSTWDQELAFTWSSIGTADSSTVATVVNTGLTATSRKFVRLGRGLRFRQIFFRLVFTTDGTPSTAPVRLFGITTRVATKETVVDSVT